MKLTGDISYYEVVKGNKFNRNHFSRIKTILDVDLFGKPPIEAYVSSFRYPEDVKTYVKSNGKIRGYIGPVKTDFLYWDFDSKDLLLAYSDTKELIERLQDAKIPDSSIRVDFSGKKGFHVIVPNADIAMLGARPNINSIVKDVCLFFAEELSTADDLIYNRTGIFRVLNSRHPDTKRFCIPLTVEEFVGNTFEAIDEMAKHQKKTPEDFDKNPHSYKSVDLAIKRAFKTGEATNNTRTKNSGIGYSALVNGIINGFPDGQWNSGFTATAGVLHKHGLDDGLVTAVLTSMNNNGEEPMPESTLQTIVASVSKYKVDEQWESPENNDIVTFRQAGEDWVQSRLNYKEIHTGYKMLDEKLFNFDFGKVMVIAAYSRVGKTNFGLQLANNICSFDEEDGLFQSLEMNARSIFYRGSVIHASEEGDIKSSKAHTDKLLADESYREKIYAQFKSLKIVDKSSVTTEQIDNFQSLAENLSAEQGRKSRLLLIDYVELIKNTEDAKRLAQAAREIKGIAKRHDIKVILLAQLNRTGGDEYAEPTTNSIKGSSEIFNQADVVLTLWRSSEQKNRIHLKELKNREDEDGLIFDLIQTGLSYEEATYVPDVSEAGGGFWGS